MKRKLDGAFYIYEPRIATRQGADKPAASLLKHFYATSNTKCKRSQQKPLYALRPMLTNRGEAIRWQKKKGSAFTTGAPGNGIGQEVGKQLPGVAKPPHNLIFGADDSRGDNENSVAKTEGQRHDDGRRSRICHR